MHDLLTEPIISLSTRDGLIGASLPQTLTLLAKDVIEGFPALRPHQAPAWHAFLVQLAFLAAERSDIPPDATGWAAALRGLTQDWPDNEPWCLVARPETPAFLQPAVPGGDLSAYTGRSETPDALDPLVTSKNHDLKASRMRAATPEDWLFALVNLQTAEGVMGAGKYGIMRMNGGYGSRPFLGAMPSGGLPGARFHRDLAALRRRRNLLAANAQGFATEREVGLVWLEPWDGTASLATAELHPLAIEICRRIRLEAMLDGRLRARSTGSAVARIAAKALRGVTGDPWAPIETSSKEGSKVLSVTADGFGWRRMLELLVPSVSKDRNFTRPLLAQPGPEDGTTVEIHAAALARGQGKTEGFHTRRLLVRSPAAVAALTEEGEERQRLTELARGFTDFAMIAANRCLRPALFILFQKGPETAKLDRPSTGAQITPWMQRFDRLVDRTFFDTLWPGVASEAAQATAEQAWSRHLHAAARTVFEQAAEAAPATDQRRIFAAQRARDLLRHALHKNLPLPATAAEPEAGHAG